MPCALACRPRATLVGHDAAAAALRFHTGWKSWLQPVVHALIALFPNVTALQGCRTLQEAQMPLLKYAIKRRLKCHSAGSLRQGMWT